MRLKLVSADIELAKKKLIPYSKVRSVRFFTLSKDVVNLFRFAYVHHVQYMYVNV